MTDSRGGALLLPVTCTFHWELPMKHHKLALAALLAGTSLPTMAMADDTVVPPPEHYSLDARNVDRITDSTTWPMTDIQIGPQGAGGLTLVSYNGRSNGVAAARGTNWENMSITASGSTYSVGLGDTGDPFSKSGTTYTSLAGDGATLTQSGSVYTYTSATGIKIVYDFIATANSETNVVARASSITYPTGEVVTLTWQAMTYCSTSVTDDPPCTGIMITKVRLQSVVNSTGYMLHYDYANNHNPPISLSGAQVWGQLNEVYGLNTTLDYCDPNAGKCTGLTQTAPAASYSYSSAPTGNEQDWTVVNATGTWKFTTDIGLFAVKTPMSASANDITYTLLTDGTDRVSQVNWRGIVYNYTSTIASGVNTVVSTDPLSHATTTTADMSIARIKTYKDALNNTTSYTYSSGGLLTDATMPEGNSVHFALDGRGNLTTTTYHPKSGTGTITTSAVYPTSCTNVVTCNLPTSITDANSHTTAYTYDPTHGGVLTVTQPAVGGISPKTTYTYTALQAYVKNSAGSIVASGAPSYRLTAVSACRTTASCAGTADEVKTGIVYGSAGVANNLLPTSASSGAGDGSLTATTALTYDNVGNVLTVDGPLAGTADTTRYVYDGARRMVGVIGPDPDGAGTLKNRAQRYTFNGDGNVTLAEQGTTTGQTDTDWAAFVSLQQVATTYDSADRKAQDSATAGGTTYSIVQYSYDAASRLQCTAQRMNPAIFASLPSSACTLGTTGSFGPDRIAFDTYDNADRLLMVTTGYGVTTANHFPATLQRDEETVSYSDNGQIKTLADAKNNLTTYVYDGFDRLSQTQYPSPTTPGTSNTADYEQLGYDAAGNVTGRRLRGSTLPLNSYDITYGYDALERMNSKALPSPEHAITYAYDNFGEPTTITGATTLSYGWDDLGRMTGETQAYGSVAYQYDLANRRIRLTWQDGIYLTYDYLVTGETTGISENGTTLLAGYYYDDLGRRASRYDGNGSNTSYSYDGASRLTSLGLNADTSATTITLSNYSPAGEIGARANSNDAFAWGAGVNGAKAFAVNGLNQFTTVSGASQSYDGRGNLTGTGGVTYGYTSENLLKSASTGQTLAYDPIGRLHEYDAPTATRFVYDGGMISEELNTSGTVLRRYAFGPGGDEPIVWYEGSGTTTRRYIDQDERGSVTRITNQDGSTYAINSYDEYGVPGSGNRGRFGYTGQAWLSEIGLAYYKARIYSPTLGRFLQTDPIGYADGPNWYNYVAGDPINLIDPSGSSSCIPVFCQPKSEGGSGGSGASGGGGGEIVVTGSLSDYYLALLEHDLAIAGVELTQQRGGQNADPDPIVVTAKKPKKPAKPQKLVNCTSTGARTMSCKPDNPPPPSECPPGTSRGGGGCVSDKVLQESHDELCKGLTLGGYGAGAVSAGGYGAKTLKAGGRFAGTLTEGAELTDPVGFALLGAAALNGCL
jgi:RHS repeat-associated protein